MSVSPVVVTGDCSAVTMLGQCAGPWSARTAPTLGTQQTGAANLLQYPSCPFDHHPSTSHFLMTPRFMRVQGISRPE